MASAVSPSGEVQSAGFAFHDHERRKQPGLATSDVDSTEDWEKRQKTHAALASLATTDDEKLYLFKSDKARRAAVLARVVFIGLYNFTEHEVGGRQTMKDEEKKLQLFNCVTKAINSIQRLYPNAYLFASRPALRQPEDDGDNDNAEEEDDDDDEDGTNRNNSWKSALVAHKNAKPHDHGDLIDPHYVHALLGRLKVFLWKAAAVIHRGKLLDATGKAVYDRTQVPQLASGYNLKTVMAAVRFRVLESLQSLAKPPKKLNIAWEWTFYQDGAGAEVLKGCETDATDRYDHCSCRAMYVPVHCVCNRPCTRARACAFVVSKCLYACVRVRNARTHRLCITACALLCLFV